MAGSDQQQARRIAATETFRREVWVIEKTKPTTWAAYVYTAALQERAWLLEAKDAAVESFCHKLPDAEDQARSSAKVAGDAFLRLNGAKQTLILRGYMRRFVKNFDGSGNEVAFHVVQQFVDRHFNGSEHVALFALLDFMLIAIQMPVDKLTRFNPLLTEMMALVTSVSETSWASVIREKTLSERAFRHESTKAGNRHTLIREKTIVKYAKAWVALRLPETEGGALTTTLEEIAHKLALKAGKTSAEHMPESELSKALRPLDEAMGHPRQRGAPTGKPHLLKNIRAREHMRREEAFYRQK